MNKENRETEARYKLNSMAKFLVIQKKKTKKKVKKFK